MLIRLTPVPFGPASYMFGVTKVALKDFLIGSLGIFCFTSLYCYAGVSLRNLHQSKVDDLDHPQTQSHAYYIIAIEIVLALTIGAFITYKAKQTLK